MAFALIIWKGCFWKTIKSTFSFIRHPRKPVNDETEHLYIPYGVAIALGSLLTLFMAP
jgi:Flp pilus assembly protein protease CpaA